VRFEIPTPVVMQRILDRIQVSDAGCWEFQGARRSKLGYGSICIGPKRSMSAHRAMWILMHGELETKQFVCHKCDNPLCCNPGHLFVGSLADNNRDMASKGRYNHQKRTHCIHGHEFTPENTYVPPSQPSRRVCKACQAIRHTLTKEQLIARRKYDGSVRRRDRKKLYRELSGLQKPQCSSQDMK